MFTRWRTIGRTSSVTLTPGVVASVVVHGVLGIALQAESGTDGAQVSRWEAAVQRLTYVAPPDVRSTERRAALMYAPGGVAGDGPAAARAGGTAGDGQPGHFADDDRGAPVRELAEPAVDPYADAFQVIEVEEVAERDPSSAAPTYPPTLLALGVEGHATLRFVVDTTGRVDPLSVRVLDATHGEFAAAVRDALPGMRFRPARRGARAVRQLADQQFKFQIAPQVAARP